MRAGTREPDGRPGRARVALSGRSSTVTADGGAPLAETLARGYRRVHRGCHLGARVTVAPVGAAGRLDELVSGGRRVDALLARIGADVGSGRRDVQASLFLEAYAWTLLLPLAGALVAERRVPLLSAGSVAVTLRNGLWPDELMLCHHAFAALADDPRSTHRDATVVEDDDTLTGVLRDQIVAHMRVPIRALSARSGRAERALWRSVGDRAAAALLFAGETVDDAERASELAEVLLGPPGPLLGRADYRELPGPDGPMRVHVRSGCCLWWRTRAASCCLTCPLSVREAAARPS